MGRLDSAPFAPTGRVEAELPRPALAGLRVAPWPVAHVPHPAHAAAAAARHLARRRADGRASDLGLTARFLETRGPGARSRPSLTKIYRVIPTRYAARRCWR